MEISVTHVVHHLVLVLEADGMAVHALHHYGGFLRIELARISLLLGGVSSIENLRLLVAEDLVWLSDQVFPCCHLQVTVLRPREAQLIVEG